jgi:starvation-inducible DNA-binding protein
MLEPNLGLEPEARKKSAELLTALLADEFLVYVQALNFHWNVIGPDFKVMHALFQDIYSAQPDVFDTIAERIRALGFPAIGTMAAFLEHSKLKEFPITEEGSLDQMQMVGVLLNCFQSMIRTARESEKICIANGDIASSDLFIEIARSHEKISWMLRATLS